MLTSLQDDSWVKLILLKLIFHRLYHILDQKRGNVGRIGVWKDGNLVCNLQWVIPLFDYEHELVDGILLAILGTIFFLERGCWF